MQINGIENTAAWLYYYPLLLRYAKRIIKDNAAALLLAKKVLCDQFIIDGLQESAKLRQLLKTDMLHRCCCHTQMQVFDRSPVKLPFK
ncbi:hypothetical protein [Ferruginibacter sp.]|nr:hypothetical protein [Ferruginibacter sp.]